MSLDYTTLDLLRQSHPAWRLHRSEHAPLAASFLHRVFIAPNVRAMAQADLAEALEDELYALRERLGNGAFPKTALDYLNDWAANDKGWLRKYYRPCSDEPQFDLTPATEKAIAWLAGLFRQKDPLRKLLQLPHRPDEISGVSISGASWINGHGSATTPET